MYTVTNRSKHSLQSIPSYGASIATVPIGYAGGRVLEAFGAKVIQGYQNLFTIRRAFAEVKRVFPVFPNTIPPSNIDAVICNLFEFARPDAEPPYPSYMRDKAQKLILQQIILQSETRTVTTGIESWRVLLVPDGSPHSSIVTACFQNASFMLDSKALSLMISDDLLQTNIRDLATERMYRMIVDELSEDSKIDLRVNTKDRIVRTLIEWHFHGRSRSFEEHRNLFHWLLHIQLLDVVAETRKPSDSTSMALFGVLKDWLRLILAAQESDPYSDMSEILPPEFFPIIGRKVQEADFNYSEKALTTHPLSSIVPVDIFIKLAAINARLARIEAGLAAISERSSWMSQSTFQDVLSSIHKKLQQIFPAASKRWSFYADDKFIMLAVHDTIKRLEAVSIRAWEFPPQLFDGITSYGVGLPSLDGSDRKSEKVGSGSIHSIEVVLPMVEFPLGHYDYFKSQYV